MDRNQAKEFYPILQAFAEGKTIETRIKPTADNNGVTKDGWYEFNCWTEMKELEYRVNVEYRIKPEPKYRPFSNAEECWKEMQKHQPFGWIKSKNNGTISKYMFIDRLQDENASINNIEFTYNELFKYYIFIDGQSFGVKEEE